MLAPSVRRSSLRHACFRLLASLSAAAVAIACGGGPAKAPASGAVAADAGADDGGGAETALPPMASVPPPGVAGSKKATQRADSALAACSGAATASAKDPAGLVKELGEACAAASTSTMKPVTAVLRGRQSASDPHQESKLRVDANRCYRVYVAGDASIKDLVVVLRDSAGDIVAEAPGPAVPEGGAVCFSASDEIALLVGVGRGAGAWAAQVWSD